MNPLAALRSFATPAMMGTPPTLPEAGAVQIKPIELEKLPGAATVGDVRGIGSSGAPFESVLKNLVTDVTQKQRASAEAVNGLLSGQNVALHQAMIAMEEASVSFHLMVEVRNKLLESYQELMRMQM